MIRILQPDSMLVPEILLVMAVGATLLIALTFLAVKGRYSASLRFWIWQTMFCSLLLLPIVGIFAPPLALGWKLTNTSSQPTSTDNSRPSVSPWPENILESPSRDTVTVEANVPTAKTTKPHGYLPNHHSRLDKSSEATSAPLELNMLSPIHEHGVPTQQPLFHPISITCVMIWTLGFLVVFMRIVKDGLQTKSIVKAAILIEPDEVAVKADMQRDEFDFAKIYISNQTTIPFATGIIFPRIVLTVESLQNTPEALQMIIRHELAHLRRRDMLWQLICSLVIAFYWYHPLVWLANRLTQSERERACDDSVLLGGANPETYATLLLTHARKLVTYNRQSSRHHSTAFSIAQPPLERRLIAILDQGTRRKNVTNWQRLVLALVAGILVIGVGMVRPFSPLPAAAADVAQDNEQQENSQTKLPETVTGKIIDATGKPIAGAKIELQYVTWEENESTLISRRRDHKSWNLVTDADGIYRLQTKGLDASKIRLDMAQTNFFGWVSGAGRVTQQIHQSGKYVVENGKIRNIVLPRGRTITGRVVAPTEDKNRYTVVHPRVQVAGPNFWFSRPLSCDEQGFFSLSVPRVGQIEILATADNYAATRVFANKGESVGAIPLKPGIPVAGQVTDENGKPVAGAIVTIRNDYFNNIEKLHLNGILVIQSAIKTDMSGRYRLPPHWGPCTVAVVSEARTHDADSNFCNLQSDRKPLIVAPQSVKLDGSKSEINVNFQTVDLVHVTGTIRWPDDSPAVGVDLNSYLMAGGRSVGLEKTRTNARGEYHFQFPKDSNHAGINCLGIRNTDSIWHYAVPENNLDARQKSRQILGLKQLKTNLTGADWKLVAKKTSKSKATKVSARSKTADLSLAEISARFFRTPATERNYKTVLQELLELEKTYRGETASLNALRQVLDWTADQTDPAMASIHSQTIQTVSQHYLSHPHLDSVMSCLSYQLRLPISLEFLKRAAKKSPHSQVKASAILFQAKFLAIQIENRRTFAERKWKLPGIDQLSPTEQNEFKRFIAEIRASNPAESRKQIAGLATQLKSQFGNQERLGFISNIQSFRQRRYQSKSKKETFGQLAEQVSFRVFQLRPGQVVADWEGKDVNQRKFKLSDFRGKVVVIMFSANWCGPCKRIYPLHRELVKKYQNRPFQMISVMADQKSSTVAEAVKSGEITWLTTWDGNDRAIATKWNVQTYPTFFIIDHQGVIHAPGGTHEERQATIERLLKLAEKK